MDFSFIITSGISNGLIWALMCLGVYITYRILDLADLSVEGTFPLGACVAAILIFKGMPPVFATIIALIAGAMAGVITGVLHTKLKIPAILAGIITMTGLYTINMLILGFSSSESSTKNSLTVNNSIFKSLRVQLQNIDLNNMALYRILFIVILLLISILFITFAIIKIIKLLKNKYEKKSIIIVKVVFGIIVSITTFILSLISIISSKFMIGLLEYIIKNASNITVISIALIIVLIVFGGCYWFFGTEIGMSLRATGNNQRMAKAQGINTSVMIILGLAISNGLVALSGAIFAQNLGNSNIDMGRGVIVIGLASVIIGEGIFGRRDFKKALISVVVGSIIYYTLNAIAIELNVTNYLKLVSSILIVVILTIPLLKKWTSHSKKINERGVNNA